VLKLNLPSGAAAAVQSPAKDDKIQRFAEPPRNRPSLYWREANLSIWKQAVLTLREGP
jgi:hypothetical protein